MNNPPPNPALLDGARGERGSAHRRVLTDQTARPVPTLTPTPHLVSAAFYCPPAELRACATSETVFEQQQTMSRLLLLKESLQSQLKHCGKGCDDKQPSVCC